MTMEQCTISGRSFPAAIGTRRIPALINGPPLPRADANCFRVREYAVLSFLNSTYKECTK